MEWTEIITTIIAAYGALLATYTLVAQLRGKKPRIRVKASMGFLEFGSYGTSDAMVFLSAQNVGHKAVTLSSKGLLLPKKGRLFLLNPKSDVSFPYELLPERDCRVWIEARQLATDLKSRGFSGRVRLVGYYGDQADRIHKSKPFKFDVDDWANPT